MLRIPSIAAASILSVTLFASPAAAASAWPASTTGTNLGGGLDSCPWLGGGTGTPPGFEPSGIVWDDFTGALWIVGDEGQVARMERDGTSPSCWTLPGNLDLESIAVTGTSEKIYLGVEYPPQIVEYNSSSTAAPSSTGHSWLLPFPANTVNSSNGMEGMTWVPNGAHPYPASSSGGVFFASSQKNGTIYVFDVDLSTNGSTPTLLGSFTPDPTQTDISDLYYSPSTRTLFVLYDTADVLREIDTSTTQFPTINSYNLPSGTAEQEGVTLLPQCPRAATDIYLADDTSAHSVYSFTGFPQLCTTTLSPTADATTHQNSPTSNDGTATTLVTDSATSADRDFLIQFNLSSVTLSQISRADLLFYVTDGTNASPQFCPTSASWTETGVNWSNQPSCQQANRGGGATVPNGSWVSYDVASLLRNGTTSFRFSPLSSNDFVANSRQAGSNKPQLVLWLTGN
ncbi:MAG: DNRLRE domain-containing protein [Thermoanaerobaculia bacterium]